MMTAAFFDTSVACLTPIVVTVILSLTHNRPSSVKADEPPTIDSKKDELIIPQPRTRRSHEKVEDEEEVDDDGINWYRQRKLIGVV